VGLIGCTKNVAVAAATASLFFKKKKLYFQGFCSIFRQHQAE